jgi:hypothetical protein
MQSTTIMRNTSFMTKWIQDNIVSRHFSEWDHELIIEMKFMCLAEASAVGITLSELEASVGCDLIGLIATALENCQSDELDWSHESGMLSASLH